MFKLCSIEATDIAVVFGRTGPFENVPPKYDNLNVIMIGQKPDCSGYLLLSDTVVDEFTQHNSVPDGYDFIFRQSWGLSITEDVIHRVISTLRAEAYPPMEDYLDAIVKNDNDQLQKYLQDCLDVKQKYPKFSWN